MCECVCCGVLSTTHKMCGCVCCGVLGTTESVEMSMSSSMLRASYTPVQSSSKFEAFK